MLQLMLTGLKITAWVLPELNNSCKPPKNYAANKNHSVYASEIVKKKLAILVNATPFKLIIIIQ